MLLSTKMKAVVLEPELIGEKRLEDLAYFKDFIEDEHWEFIIKNY